MNDDKLEKLLYNFGEQKIIPDDDLIVRTKERIGRNGKLFKISLAISLLINFVFGIVILSLFLLPQITILWKVIILGKYIFVVSVIIGLLITFNEKIADQLIKFEKNLNSSS